MSWWGTPHGILASCVNDGGIFRLDASGVECVSARDTTGMCAWPRGLLWARQGPGPTELGLVDTEGLRDLRLTDQPLDLHDALWHDATLYLVATQTNTVSAFDVDLRETQRWVFEGEPDSHHINSVCMHEGRLLASRFGDFRLHRAYKGATRGAGQVFDVHTGRVVIEGLSQPHSLRSHAGMLWVCDSEAQRVLAYRDGRLVHEVRLDGYPRGLLLVGDRMLVGLSRSRNVAPGGVAQACVVALAGPAWREEDRIQLPAPEVYELLPAPAQLPDLSQQALAEARTMIREAAHGRNVASADAHALREQCRAQAAELANLRVQVAQRSFDTAGERGRVREELAWCALLEGEASALRARLETGDTVLRDGMEVAAMAQEAIRASRSAVFERDAYIRDIVSTRTWRWTRWLRRAKAEAPLPPEDDGTRAMDQLDRSRDAMQGLLGLAPVLAADHADVPVEGLAFTTHTDPVVTVLVASFGKYEHTRTCLESIARCGDSTPFEVILVEDGSQEARMERFSAVPGLAYVSNPANVGFLRSVNAAASHARGRYLVLLNNDTRVRPGWLDGLYRSFTLLDGCGLAGSKLVYPHGALQEAGAIVWSDATGCNVGRGEDPESAAFQAARRVDYVSGASIMIETSLFRELGGFDDRFAPAYYEDTDLAFRVRQSGRHVYYQPESVVEHVEGLSHGTDAGSGGKAAQGRNRVIFLERWRDELAREQCMPGEHPLLARERSQLAKSMLVVDHYAPRCDQDAGSKAMWALLRTLQQMGFCVRFWSLADTDQDAYTATLRRHGIEVRVGDAQALSHWLGEHGAYVDNVLLSRPAVAAAAIAAVRTRTDARVVFYGHDIHHLRIAGQARISAEPGLRRQEQAVKRAEEEIWRSSDAVLYPTDEETTAVRGWLESHGIRGTTAATIPLLAFDRRVEPVDPSPGGLAARNEILFVGNYQHAPNEDGAVWFAREVWPLLRETHPRLRLVLAGANVTTRVAELAADPTVELAGRISDVELDRRYACARVVIAPLRFGAGLKGKVVEAMHHGVPVVTTSIGAQGLRDAECLRVEDDAKSFSAAVSRLVEEPEEWREASIGGQRYANGRFSTEAIAMVMSTVADPSPYPDVQARRDRIASATARIARGDRA